MVDVGDIPYFVVGSASRSENSHMAKYAKHNNFNIDLLRRKTLWKWTAIGDCD